MRGRDTVAILSATLFAFSKYHALGNDYLVIDPQDLPAPLTTEQVRTICHRNFGVGSDGILLGPLPAEKAQFGLKIYNPDGSEAEKSGNGLRIFSRYLFDRQLVGTQEFTIQTAGGLVRSTVFAGGGSVQVEMGRVSFQSEKIPVTGPAREVLNERITAGGREFTFCAATIGNPHCVLPLPEISAKLAHEFGPLLETHALFPRRTNVQFLKVLDRGNIQIEIWERGAGYTLASGSSSSAAAAVAHRLGLCDQQISVHMPGGVIAIEIGADYAIRMTGGVTRVTSGVMAEEMIPKNGKLKAESGTLGTRPPARQVPTVQKTRGFLRLTHPFKWLRPGRGAPRFDRASERSAAKLKKSAAIGAADSRTFRNRPYFRGQVVRHCLGQEGLELSTRRR